MRKFVVVTASLALAGGALAQSTSGPQDANGGASGSAGAPASDDPGRITPNDRDGLSGRGGANPAGTQNSYSARIGTPIYSPIGTPVASSRPSPPPR